MPKSAQYSGKASLTMLHPDVTKACVKVSICCFEPQALTESPTTLHTFASAKSIQIPKTDGRQIHFEAPTCTIRAQLTTSWIMMEANIFHLRHSDAILCMHSLSSIVSTFLRSKPKSFPSSTHNLHRPSSTFIDLHRPSSTFIDLHRPSSTFMVLSWSCFT